MSLYCSVGSPDTDLSDAQLKELLVESLAKPYMRIPLPQTVR